MIDFALLAARNAALGAFVDWDRSATNIAGPLSHLTVGIKSNIAVAGLPWTAGMALHRDRIAVRDAEVTARLRAAGAAILGTLNMHEAALGATTDNAWFGRTHNAHRQGYTPGGSSGGSAAAVAAGLCDAALGTDTMGSVRIPAAYNGIYGLKPTNGGLSHDGVELLMADLDTVGPLARDLATLERVWAVLSSPLPRKGGGTGAERQGEETVLDVTAPLPASFGSCPSPLQGEGRVYTLANLAGVDTQTAVAAAYTRVLAQLPPTTELTLPHPPAAVRMAGFVACGRWLIGSLGDARREHAELISPELHFMLDFAERSAPRPDILVETKAFLTGAIGDDGVLIMPTAPQAAFAHTARPPPNQSDFTCLASVAGLPALAVPAGRDDTGMPVGVQLVGPAGSEATLFALARHLEGA